MGRETPQWMHIIRTLAQHNDDEHRVITDNVPPNLDGAILLLVKSGDDPVHEYLYGLPSELEAAGKLAGFGCEPLPGGRDPELPEDARNISHPIIPSNAKLNARSIMKDMRSDWSGMRKSIEANMPPNSYVSIHLRLKGKTVEDDRVRDWVASEYATTENDSELVSSNTMCARVSVGCMPKDNSARLAQQTGKALFPLISAVEAHRSRPRFAMFAVMLALTAAITLHPVACLAWDLWEWKATVGGALASLAGWVVLMVINHFTPKLSLNVPAMAACLSAMALWWASGIWDIPMWIVAVPACAGVMTGVRWMRWDVWDDIFTPPHRYWWVKRTRTAEDSDNSTKLGVERDQTRVDGYCTARSTLLLTPPIIVAIITPTGQGEAKRQELHPAPEPLTHGGILVGVDQSGRDTYIPVSQLFGGIAIFGEAGSGKSVLSHGIMQWADMARDTTDAKAWGKDTRIIDFEMKDIHGADLMQAWRAHHPTGVESHVMRMADPACPCIDLLGYHDARPVRELAADATAAMQFSFEDGDIRGASAEVLTHALTIGMAVQRHVERQTGQLGGLRAAAEAFASRIRELEQRYNGAGKARAQRTPMGWSYMALGGTEGAIGTARALGQMVFTLSKEQPDDSDLRDAQASCEQLYGHPDGKVTDASNTRIDTKVMASRNKIMKFMNCEHVFRTSRAVETWESVLARPSDWHIALCPVHDAQGRAWSLPDGMTDIIGKWLMYRLWHTVMSTCQGWQALGKHTMFVCDEVSMLATADDTILSAMKDQGRSFGWIPVVATQYPEQLAPRLLTSVFGYSTFITFNTPDASMAERTAAQLTSDMGEDGWTASAVQTLPRFHVALRTRDDVQLQPACLVKVPDFDEGLR